MSSILDFNIDTSVNSGDNRHPTPHDTRVHNFSAGPGCLPLNALTELQDELVSYEHSGMSLLEMSHRIEGGPVQKTMTDTCQLVKDLLKVPDNYHILLFPGGAHAQFAAGPLNLANVNKKIDFVDTGVWGKKAMVEARKYADVQACATVTNAIVPSSEWKYRSDADYIHLCLNETISGIEYLADPVLPEGAPFIVADATSTLFSRPIDISRYGLIYCSAGKNIGPAGVCIVIVRDDLITARDANPYTPGILSYKEAAFSQPIPSVYNTPPVFQIFFTKKILLNYFNQGGMSTMETCAIKKSSIIYDIVKNSNGFYVNHIDIPSRSRMNVCFTISRTNVMELEDLFIEEAKTYNMYQLEKHPLYYKSGGLRITIYNNCPDEAVACIAEFMHTFAEKYQ